MARIVDALYKNGQSKRLLNITSVTSGEYSDKYKNKLYCTTPNCSAKLSFVYKQNNGSYFRTWRESRHIENCIYYFEKLNERAGYRRNGYVNGTVSAEQIKRSLLEAFENELMSQEAREQRRQLDRQNRARRKRDKLSKNNSVQPVQRIVSNPEEINENTIVKGTRLYKRDADALKDTDIGHTRTVTGVMIEINYAENIAVVKIEKNAKLVTVKFEEAFFASNNQYQGLFHHAQRYMQENEKVVFSATGEVRENKTSGGYEIIVFNGVGFLIHGRSLESISSEYSIRDNAN